MLSLQFLPSDAARHSYTIEKMYSAFFLATLSRSKKIEKMEDMLIVWMQDLIHKHDPLSGLAIRQQVLAFYNFLKEKSPALETKLLWLAEGDLKSSKKYSRCTTFFSVEKKLLQISRPRQVFLENFKSSLLKKAILMMTFSLVTRRGFIGKKCHLALT